MVAEETVSKGRGMPLSRNGGRYGVSLPCMRSSCAPNSIHRTGRSASLAACAFMQAATSVSDDTVASKDQRTSRGTFCDWISSLIGSFPRSLRLSGFVCVSRLSSRSPVFRDADADQTRIGEEHIGCQVGVVAIEERAG